MMQPYKDRTGDSGIAAYELGEGSITIEFHKGGVYLYNAERPGASHVHEMRKLAEFGDGLNTYINKFVRRNHAGKIR